MHSRLCKFDPGILLCKGAETDGCLTAPQVGALRKIYSGPHTSGGDRIYPGFPATGAEFDRARRHLPGSKLAALPKLEFGRL